MSTNKAHKAAFLAFITSSTRRDETQPTELQFAWIQGPSRETIPSCEEWLLLVDGELGGRVWRRNPDSEFIAQHSRGELFSAFPTLEEAQKAVEKAELEFWYA